ncbi:hypothetical protein J3A83DRAFT_4193488 [Scleroderma citrinum]
MSNVNAHFTGLQSDMSVLEQIKNESQKREADRGWEWNTRELKFSHQPIQAAKFKGTLSVVLMETPTGNKNVMNRELRKPMLHSKIFGSSGYSGQLPIIHRRCTIMHYAATVAYGVMENPIYQPLRHKTGTNAQGYANTDDQMQQLNLRLTRPWR